MSALPSMEMITNIYLYGSSVVPINMLSQDIANFSGSERQDLFVDVDDYMAGPGRFANPKKFLLLQKFFNDNLLEPGVYSKAEVIARFTAITGNENWGLEVYQQFYDDGRDNYRERAYIWASTSFKINDDAIFIVGQNGSKSIQNFAIVPRGDENFDFVGGVYSYIPNTYLSPNVDPSGIGRQVKIKFEGVPVTTNMDAQGFAGSVDISPSPSLGLSFRSGLLALVETLFDGGSIKFLDSAGRPIIYGTVGRDDLSGAKTRIGVDISSDRYLLASHILREYSHNGYAYVVGDGDDVVHGGSFSDVVYGGRGNDIIFGAGASRTEEAGAADILYGDEGNDTLEGGGGATLFMVVLELIHMCGVGAMV